jgi:predicted phosphoadenosine phosphosulfate sulfurtransferase
MAATRQGLGVDVLTAARQRVRHVFANFPRIVCSFSGGKDSTVMLDIVAQEARRTNRRFALAFVDLEAQYKLTIDHVADCFARYADVGDPYWIAVPLTLRNAVSVFEPQWTCWDPDARDMWVRERPCIAIASHAEWTGRDDAVEFEELVPAFANWYSQGQLCASLVGIRTSESLNRWRAVTGKSANFEGLRWTTYKGRSCYNAYPIYDWSTQDIWTYHAKTGCPYNGLYDRMHQAGLSIHQARICQPYGDDQRKGLWLYHALEPETWASVVARVQGANQGALYSQESGNILGRLKVTKPAGHTWESFTRLLLSTLPEPTRLHYEDKIWVFLKWYKDRGYEDGIPDEGPANDRAAPSWTRICKAILRNDYWCKGLSFTQHKSEAFKKYQDLMKRRRQTCKLI